MDLFTFINSNKEKFLDEHDMNKDVRDWWDTLSSNEQFRLAQLMYPNANAALTNVTISKSDKVRMRKLYTNDPTIGGGFGNMSSFDIYGTKEKEKKRGWFS